MDGLSVRVGVVGCCGRLGSLAVAAVIRRPGLVLSAANTSPGSPRVGGDLGELLGLAVTGVVVGAEPEALCDASDAIIDFSAPAATALYASAAAARGKVFVTGTTGLDAAQQQAVRLASRRTAIVQAPHMSLGANLLMDLVEQLAGVLDERYDIDVLGKTHRAKADVPSGTSLALASAAARGRRTEVEAAIQAAQPGTHGPRPAGSIGVTTIRSGEAFSEHIVLFATRGERMEVSHSLLSYEVCAEGAADALLWARTRPPGLYSMSDVLKINTAR